MNQHYLLLSYSYCFIFITFHVWSISVLWNICQWERKWSLLPARKDSLVNVAELLNCLLYITVRIYKINWNLWQLSSFKRKMWNLENMSENDGLIILATQILYHVLWAYTLMSVPSEHYEARTLIYGYVCEYWTLTGR